MSCLNQDLLFRIGKKLIEEGKQEDVYRFALSGKEPFYAMKRIFSTVTSLKLYADRYYMGWENRNYIFEFGNDKPHSSALMNCIGNSVQDLYVDDFFPTYKSIIDKIAAQKQLITFSAGGHCDITFLNEFIRTFSSTLKHLQLYGFQVTPALRDPLNLESLTLMGTVGSDFLSYCCKTSTLEFLNPDTWESTFRNIQSTNHSPNLSSIKELIFNETDVCKWSSKFDKIMAYFPSCDSLKFNCFLQTHCVHHAARVIPSTIERLIKTPSKMTFSFYKALRKLGITNRKFYTKLCKNYEMDESNPKFYRFYHTFQTLDGKQSTELEINIGK